MAVLLRLKIERRPYARIVVSLCFLRGRFFYRFWLVRKIDEGMVDRRLQKICICNGVFIIIFTVALFSNGAIGQLFTRKIIAPFIARLGYSGCSVVLFVFISFFTIDSVFFWGKGGGREIIYGY